MTPTGNRMSAEERREDILEAALDVFAQKGFSGARTKEIAEKAGISETLMFRHFETKENLYAEALKHLFDHHPVVGEMEPAMAAGDDREVFRALASHVMMHGRNDERIVRLTLFSGLEGLDWYNDTSPLPMLEEYIQKRIDEGAFRKVNPAWAARYFMYAAFFYVSDLHMKLTGPLPGGGDKAAAEALVDIFLGGLLPR
jgi:TetR/AcrR family transcriptional regulator